MTQTYQTPAPQPVIIVDGNGERGFSPVTEVDNDFTGIKTVTTAGTPVTGPNIDSPTGFMLIAHPDNTDVMWYFPRGRTKAAGYPVSKTNPVFINVKNLSVLSFDADVNGEKICWTKV